MKILFVVDVLTVMGEAEMHMITLANIFAKDVENKVYIYTDSITDNLKNLLERIFLIEKFCLSNDKKIEKLKLDVIHVNPFYSIQKGIFLADETNTKLYLTVHKTLNKFLNKDIAFKFKKIFYIDEVAKTALDEIHGDNVILKGKLMSLSTPVDDTKFKPKVIRAKKITGLLKKNYKTLLIYSRNADGKEVQINQLLQILPMLAQSIQGLNIILLSDTNYIIGSNLQSDFLNINYVGEVFNTVDYINVADLVLASDRAAIESVLCEKPVLYMGCEGWKELINSSNFYSLIFTKDKFRQYTNDELLETMKNILLAERDRVELDKTSELIKPYVSAYKVANELYSVYLK